MLFICIIWCQPALKDLLPHDLINILILGWHKEKLPLSIANMTFSRVVQMWGESCLALASWFGWKKRALSRCFLSKDSLPPSIFHLIAFGSAFLAQLIKTLSVGHGCMRAYSSISPFLGRKALHSYHLTTKWDKTQGYLSVSPSSYFLNFMQSTATLSTEVPAAMIRGPSFVKK